MICLPMFPLSLPQVTHPEISPSTAKLSCITQYLDVLISFSVTFLSLCSVFWWHNLMTSFDDCCNLPPTLINPSWPSWSWHGDIPLDVLSPGLNFESTYIHWLTSAFPRINCICHKDFITFCIVIDITQYSLTICPDVLSDCWVNGQFSS